MHGFSFGERGAPLSFAVFRQLRHSGAPNPAAGDAGKGSHRGDGEERTAELRRRWGRWGQRLGFIFEATSETEDSSVEFTLCP